MKRTTAIVIAVLLLCALGVAQKVDIDKDTKGNLPVSRVTGAVQKSGTPTTGNCVQWTGSGTVGDAGAACGTGSGAGSVDGVDINPKSVTVGDTGTPAKGNIELTNSSGTKTVTIDGDTGIEAGTVKVGTTLPATYYGMAAWGDSLTGGGQDGTGITYPDSLGQLFGLSVYNGGVGGETSTQIKTRMLAATDKAGDITLIWAGHNNASDPTTVENDIAAMVAAIPAPKRFVVLKLLNLAGADAGALANVAAVNNWIATTYPDNYLSPCDVLNCTSNSADASYRYDSLHLNAAGYTLVAGQVNTFLRAKKWLPSVPSVQDVADMLRTGSAYVKLPTSLSGMTSIGFGSLGTAITVGGDGTTLVLNAGLTMTGKVISAATAYFDTLNAKGINVGPSQDIPINGSLASATKRFAVGYFEGLDISFANSRSIKYGATATLGIGGDTTTLVYSHTIQAPTFSGTTAYLTNLNMNAKKSTTGTRFACFDTSGNLTSSTTACSGT